MRIVELRVDENAILSVTDGSLESMQKLVDGYIEVVQLTDTISLVCNEEGKIRRGFEPNRKLIVDGKAVDVIYGDCFFIGNDEEDFKSLTDDDINEIYDMVHGTHKNVWLEEFCK